MFCRIMFSRFSKKKHSNDRVSTGTRSWVFLGVFFRSFTVKMIKGNRYKAGWQVIARFAIVLHRKELAWLKQIQSFFGVGVCSFKRYLLIRFILLKIQLYNLFFGITLVNTVVLFCITLVVGA